MRRARSRKPRNHAGYNDFTVATIEALRRFFFGDDVFISYSRRQGADYALALANELTRRGLSCFLDQWGTPPGRELPPALKHALRRSTMLVLIGSEAAAASENVRLEVEEFLGTGRPLIPITFVEDSHYREIVSGRAARIAEGTLERAAWYSKIEGVARTFESFDAMEKREPSAQVIDRVVNAEGFTRRNKRLRNVFWSTFTAIVLFVAGGAVAVKVLQNRAAEAQRQQAAAERQQRRATSERLAGEALKNLDTQPQASLAMAAYAVQLFAEAKDPAVPAAQEALWRALAGTGGMALTGHSAEINSVNVSPDRRWLATASAREIALWDLTRGLPPKPLFLAETAANDRTFLGARFSPDGRWLIAHQRDNRARLWRMANSAEPPQSFPLEKANAAGFSPDGRWAVTVDDTSAMLWRLSGKSPLDSPMRLGTSPDEIIANFQLDEYGNPAGDVTAAAISDDFRYVVLGRFRAGTQFSGQPSTLFDLTAADPKDSATALEGFPDWLDLLTATRDGRWIAAVERSVSHSPTEVYVAKLTPGGKPQSFVLKNLQKRPRALRFSPDSRWLVTAGEDRTALLWDLTAPRPFAEPILLGDHTGGVVHVEFSPDMRYLATGGFQEDSRSQRYSVQLWRIALSAQPSGTPTVTSRPLFMSGNLRGLRFSPDGRWLIALGNDEGRTAHVWRVEGEYAPDEEADLRGHEDAINAVDFAPDSRWLVTAGDHTVRLWQLGRSRNWKAAPRTLIGNGSPAYSIFLTRDNRWMVTVNHDGDARLWNLAANAESSVIDRGSIGKQPEIALSANGRWLASAYAGSLRLFRLDTPNPAAHPIVLSDSGGEVRALQITPDSRWLIAGFAGKSVRVWDLSSRAAVPSSVALRSYDGELFTLALSSDSRWLATADLASPVVRLWSLEALGAPAIALKGHRAPIISLAFSPDRHWIAALAENGAVRLWNLAAERPAEDARTLKERADKADFLQFTGTGGHLIASAAHPEFRIYNTTVWDLTAPDFPVRIRVRSEDPELRRVEASPDGRWLVTQLHERTESYADTNVVLLWDLHAPGASPVRLSAEHDRAVFSSDSRWLLIETKVWDLTAEQPVYTRVELPAIGDDMSPPEIGAGAISHDSRLVVISTDDRINFYPLDVQDLLGLADRAAMRNLTEAEWSALFPLQPYRKIFPRVSDR